MSSQIGKAPGMRLCGIAAVRSPACSQAAPSAPIISVRSSIRLPPFEGRRNPRTAPPPSWPGGRFTRTRHFRALIREALTNNYDLRIAVARVEQARAVAMQARSQFVPSVNYSGTVSRGRNDFLGSAFPENGATLSSVSATLNAFWEVDLWGRIRRLNESARAQFLASEEARRGVRLSLLSDVATAYFQLLELDQELEIASRTTNSFAESLRIFDQRVEGGTASALQSSRAEAALEDAAAAVPAIRDRISATENQLCILLGRNPGPIERPTALLAAADARHPGRIALLVAGTPARTCGRPSSSCARPTRKLASPSPSSFPRSG